MKHCVFGILKTDRGLKIKKEMLLWLSKKYDIVCIEQDPPGNLFEYPAIKKTAEFSIEINKPVLYIHTKGAAMDNQAQPMVRQFWKHEFYDNCEKYFKSFDQPVVVAPYTLGKRICWFNAFVINPLASKILLEYLTEQKDRYWFEQKIWQDPRINVFGIYDNIAEYKDAWIEFLHLYSLMKQNKLK